MLLGDPGTGKSTLMCFLGQLYWLAGRLRFGHMPSKSLTDSEPWMGKEITNSYVGATAGKVTRAVLDAKGGVFALDEAHTLCEGKFGYGMDALRQINGSIPNNTDILWIFAGYPQEMQDAFVDQEKGLSSRIDQKFFLEPYSPVQLAEITKRYIISVGLDVDVRGVRRLEMLFKDASNWPKDFGNARAAVTVGDKSCHSHNVDAGHSGSSSKLVSVHDLEVGFSSWFEVMEKKKESYLLAELVRFKRSQKEKEPQEFVETLDDYIRKNGPPGPVACSSCDVFMVDAFDEYRCPRCPRIRSAFCCGEKLVSQQCAVCKEIPPEYKFINWQKYQEFVILEMIEDEKLIPVLLNNAINVQNRNHGDHVRLVEDDDERIALSLAAAEDGIKMAMLVALENVRGVGRTFPFLNDIYVAHHMIHYGYELCSRLYEHELVEQEKDSSFSFLSEIEDDPAQILISEPSKSQEFAHEMLVEFVREFCVFADGKSVLSREFLVKLASWLKEKGKGNISDTMIGKLIKDKKKDEGKIVYLNVEFK